MAKAPVHEVRFGLIKASIWQNNTKVGERFNVTISRLYKNGGPLGRVPALRAAMTYRL